jgi:hypothetical protein
LEPERFEALEKAGFKLDRNAVLAELLFERFGGHYVDVGASKKIVDGLVRTFPHFALSTPFRCHFIGS